MMLYNILWQQQIATASMCKTLIPLEFSEGVGEAMGLGFGGGGGGGFYAIIRTNHPCHPC